jgi:PAS domain S-box-containing protein
MAPGPSEAAGVVADADRIHLRVDAVTEYAIYMLNPDGLVTSWNAGAEQLKGYGPAEIIGQPYERFFTREDQQRNLPLHILATAKEAGRHESEGWRVCKDGVRFLGSVILHRVQDKAGRHIGFVQVTP